jgi:hypothetical protein
MKVTFGALSVLKVTFMALAPPATPDRGAAPNKDQLSVLLICGP